MSQSVRDIEKTIVAGEDLTGKQFYIAQLDATGKLEVGEGATDLLIGVIQVECLAGEGAVYRFGGTSKVIAGGTVGIGAWVTSDSNGKAVATTTDGDITIGRALEGASSGDIFEVQLSIQHLYIA